uniref:Thymopoietin a n=1 Tax=Cyprinus carpio carpio TaxID=630221 RepID=A0A9J8AHB5_CYPCA
MSDFLEDPSVLTKDKLKSALLAHNVALPNGEQKKDVYVQLYLKNLTAQNKKSSGSPDVFSSDEELPPAPVLVSNSSRSGRKATRKTDKVRPEDVDVIDLSNEALKDLLLKYGLNAGPIVASTRKVYEKRLQKLLDQGPPETVAPPSEISQTDGRQNGIIDSDQYSDKEEETVAPAAEFVPEPEPEIEAESIPVVERPIRSRGKAPVTSRTRSGQHNRVQEVKSVTVSTLSKPHLSQTKPLIPMVSRLSPSCDGQREVFPSHASSFRDSVSRTASEDSLLVSYDISQESFGSPKTKSKTRQSKITPFFSQITSVRGLDSSQTETPKSAMVEKVSAIDQTPRTVERDVLKEIFPTENLNTPTGISATCRRPIRGAAGRPLVSDAWLDESRLRLKELRETSSSSTYTETRSVPRVAAVPLTASKPAAPPAVKSRARRSLPVWVQLLLLSAVAGFLFFVYQAMETDEVGLFKQNGADDRTSK